MKSNLWLSQSLTCALPRVAPVVLLPRFHLFSKIDCSNNWSWQNMTCCFVILFASSSQVDEQIDTLIGSCYCYSGTKWKSSFTNVLARSEWSLLATDHLELLDWPLCVVLDVPELWRRYIGHKPRKLFIPISVEQQQYFRNVGWRLWPVPLHDFNWLRR